MVLTDREKDKEKERQTDKQAHSTEHTFLSEVIKVHVEEFIVFSQDCVIF